MANINFDLNKQKLYPKQNRVLDAGGSWQRPI